MNFGQALDALWQGKRVTRDGWHGKGMWLILVPGTTNCVLSPGSPYHRALNSASQGQSHVTIAAHIDIHVDGVMQPGWLASQTDMLAQDWRLVE